MRKSNALNANIQAKPNVYKIDASLELLPRSEVRSLFFSQLVFINVVNKTSRCKGLGDVPFKQPPEFTRRILYNLLPDTHDTSPWEEFLVRNRTPPYISAEPEIIHRTIPSSSSRRPRFLILCSDGFTDLCQDRGHDRVISNWASGMVAKNNKSGKEVEEEEGENSDNMALRLLREALGGDDKMRVSAILTLDMDEPWVDDTALIVQTL
jgi:pyruvate dehydrogenase phosphatase